MSGRHTGSSHGTDAGPGSGRGCRAADARIPVLMVAAGPFLSTAALGPHPGVT